MEMNQFLLASPAKKKMKMMLTDGKIIKSVPEPKEKEKDKCVICVVDLSSQYGSNALDLDQVNFYIYDKKNFKYEAQTWPALSYKNKKWSGNNNFSGDLEPIASIDCFPSHASYITIGSYLFRIGGQSLDPPSLDPPFFTPSATSTVDIIDLNSEDDKLMMVPIKGPPMNCSRFRPHLLILQGSLYVAGGFRIQDMHFMEVLIKSGSSIGDWYWKTIPNPPPYCPGSVDVNVDDLRYNQFIAGAVESIGAIVVGFDKLSGSGYSFYTYQPTSSTWNFCTTYTNISLEPDLRLLALCQLPAVVSGKFMLWIWCPAGDYHSSTLLYVMDLGNDQLHTIDLLEKNFLPRTSKLSIHRGFPPTLLKTEEREFCVFWTQSDDPKYPSGGTDTYIALHAYTFTLEKTGEGTLDVKPKEHYISLVPHVQSFKPGNVLIADVPDNKQQRWTTFC